MSKLIQINMLARIPDNWDKDNVDDELMFQLENSEMKLETIAVLEKK